MARKPIQIDPDKLRAEVRKLGSEHVFSMLEDTIELLPPVGSENLVAIRID